LFSLKNWLAVRPVKIMLSERKAIKERTMKQRKRINWKMSITKKVIEFEESIS
jgi:hypothetical protein